MTSHRPGIGVVGHSYSVARPWGSQRVTGTPTTYVDAVLAAGGLPVVVPSIEALALVDAVVLTGGGDLDPRTYGGATDDVRDVDRDRDDHELAVVAELRRRRLPVLGVCRGMQVLAVAHGGRLASGVDRHHVRPGIGHQIRCAPGSQTRRLLGVEVMVSSVHHQHVVDPGPAWTPTAWSPDGVVEAMEWCGQVPWPALAVQWHPELDDTGPDVFGWLVRTASPASPARRVSCLPRWSSRQGT